MRFRLIRPARRDRRCPRRGGGLSREHVTAVLAVVAAAILGDSAFFSPVHRHPV
jgi:hypothetical protein